MARANHYQYEHPTAKDAKYAREKLEGDNVVEFQILPESQQITLKVLALGRNGTIGSSHQRRTYGELMITGKAAGRMAKSLL